MTDTAIILNELKHGCIKAEMMHRKHGVSRTDARVLDLRESGHCIETIKRTTTTRRGNTTTIAEYHLRVKS